MTEREIDARFFEMAWHYYCELLQDFEAAAVRELDRMQAKYKDD